jgi:hypothetical protein
MLLPNQGFCFYFWNDTGLRAIRGLSPLKIKTKTSHPQAGALNEHQASLRVLGAGDRWPAR